MTRCRPRISGAALSACCAARRESATGARPRGATLPRRGRGGSSELGARVVEASVPDATADTWPFFQFEARESHRDTFPARAEEYGELMRTKLQAAHRASDEAIVAGRRAVEEWRRYEPEVDLYVSPCIAVELPAEDADELDVRLPLSSFLRWVNLIGWAGLAIGDLQLIAPRDETVLAAGLAWERG